MKKPDARNSRAKSHSTAADQTSAKSAKKDADWDERLRTVGGANYVAVPWSTRDQPCWPLPRDKVLAQ